MTDKTVNSYSIWYHVTSGNTLNNTARWTRGAARKGTLDGHKTLSVILFDAAGIQTQIGEDQLIGAELSIKRDTAYGTDAVSVCMAPAMIREMSDTYMDRAQCMELAMRPLHKCYIVESDTAVFKIPGMMLRGIKNGEINAFMLYQEEDGTDSFCKFADSAKLKLYLGADWMEPVWTREISSGDIISDHIHSHVADLREIEYYINIKRANHDPALTAIDIGTIELPDDGGPALGSFAGWVDVIDALQDGMEEAMADTPTWLTPSDEATPQADVIENLRRIVRGGTTARIEVSGFTGWQSHTKSTDPIGSGPMRNWKTGAVAGKEKQSIIDSGVTTTVWLYHVCGWIFDEEPLPSITTASVEVLVNRSDAAKPMITLYGIVTNDTPGTGATYSDVFGSEIIGSGTCAVGTRTKITLNSRGIYLLNNSLIHGVGIRYDNTYVSMSKTASLIINE